MNFRGGCCIARYGGGGGGDMSKVDRIMLRYRPIAPKPDSSSSPKAVESVSSKSRRGKRKHSTEKSTSSGSVNSNGNSKRCNKRRNGSGVGGGVGEIVTLPLLPEAPEKKQPPSPFKVLTPLDDGRYIMKTDLKMETVASSLLTVECVTDRWVEGETYELGSTDEEKKMKLEKDTCPGFISDGLGRVMWTNASYRELVVGKEEKEVSKMSVWLVMKERPLLTYETFTCRMRLQYTCRGKDVSSVTSPCDVWRMKDGGFAWRLDLSAALCLGR